MFLFTYNINISLFNSYRRGFIGVKEDEID